MRSHVDPGNAFLAHPWFPQEIQIAVLASHENWDESGYANGLAGEAIPMTARLLGAADLFESEISGESNPLTARARARATIELGRGREIQPEISDALAQLSGSDAFWLRFCYDDLALAPLAWTRRGRASRRAARCCARTARPWRT